MKTLPARTNLSGLTLIKVLVLLALFAGVHQAAAQPAQFFRISGPAVTTITAFRANGSVVWSNALAGTNYTVQTAASLPGGTGWVSYVRLPVTHGVNTNQIVSFNPPAGMTFIPAGVFTLGDTLDGESDAKPTNIAVSAFYLDVNLVGYGQWQSVYHWAITNGYGFDHPGTGKAANQPVYAVDWYDSVKWCNARSQQAGLTPVYYTDAALTQVYTNGQVDTTNVNWAANGFRLPTEAEWEKAARGGLDGQRFPWGDTISESQANYIAYPAIYAYDKAPYTGYNTNYDRTTYAYTSPAGAFAPNGYGLADMAGNEFEWCWDWYVAPPYPAGSPYLGGSDPHGPAGPSPAGRVMRGGSWGVPAEALRCASRCQFWPDTIGGDIGFRCVRGQ
jgi:formylglycine-generating enzyme required for sulfatase activity